MGRTTLALDGTWAMKGFPAGSLSEQDAGALSADGSWIEAAVPGDVHTALLARGLIEDPTVGDNIKRCAWVLEQDWCFSRTFRFPDASAGRRGWLLFEGIDTLASVWLNGRMLGETDNMFRAWRFDLPETATDGDNRLLVLIRSVRARLRAQPPHDYVSLFDANRIFLRKTQCQFGWDCIPDLPSTGIWKSCSLVLPDEREIRDVRIETRVDGRVSFFVEVDLPPLRSELDGIRERYRPEELGLELRIGIQQPDGTSVAQATVAVSGGASYATLSVARPRLWWPNGYGEPFLYSYRVVLSNRERVVDERTGRLGIREVRLRQDPQGSSQFGFCFEVNGVPVFSKGGNWIPADLFVGAIPRERYRDLIRRAQEANCNTLRVWGGGIYESDAFYDLCDEHGIMTWQEFACACSDLPGDQEWFRQAIIPEMEHQVRRLRNHPSLVYWTGGNETASVTGCRPSRADPVLNYLVRGIIGDIDPGRPYSPSSPTTYSDLGSDPFSGDCHMSAFEPTCLNGPGSFRAELARMRTRFASEFAYQGPPRYRSLVRYLPPDALWPMNEMWELHNQRNPYSWMVKDSYSQTQRKLAEAMFGEIHGVRDFLKKAMTVHAELLGAEIEYHRSRKGENSGAMFWMFNDIWPTGTHSVIDYYLLPKPAFYAAKRSFRPLLVTIQPLEERHAVFVVNDARQAVKGYLHVGQADLKGAVLWKAKRRIEVAENSCQRVAELEPRRGVAPGTYLFARFSPAGQEAGGRFFLEPWRKIDWLDPGISFSVGPQHDGDGIRLSTVTVRAGSYARMVHLTHPDDAALVYSDNYFDMEAGSTVQLTITSEKELDTGSLALGHWLTEWE